MPGTKPSKACEDGNHGDCSWGAGQCTCGCHTRNAGPAGQGRGRHAASNRRRKDTHPRGSGRGRGGRGGGRGGKKLGRRLVPKVLVLRVTAERKRALFLRRVAHGSGSP